MPAERKQIRADRMTYRVLMHILAKEELLGSARYSTGDSKGIPRFGKVTAVTSAGLRKSMSIGNVLASQVGGAGSQGPRGFL